MSNHYKISYRVDGDNLRITLRATSDKLDAVVLRKRLGDEYGGSVTFTQHVKKDDPKARDAAERRARTNADRALNALLRQANKARSNNTP